MAKDEMNPLSFILPAGVAAYVLSPEVRKAVRGAAVRGMAGLMDLTDTINNITGKLRGEMDGLVDEAKRLREEGRKSHEVTITVQDDTTASGAAEEGAAA
jgi:hypothetical protein